ncbi:MAG: TetR/AcrR family transcriptional regulator [Clostridia bacterium]
MDKRKKENIRVKSSITDALFSLMEKKSINDIHITELVEKAHVARASFYRNYSSKDDIIITLIRDILDDYREGSDLENKSIYDYENVLRCFQYFRKYQSYILNLQRCGYTSVLLEELNNFHVSIEGDMPRDSIEKYQLYMYIGALLNTAINYLTDEREISEEDIALYFFTKTNKKPSVEA